MVLDIQSRPSMKVSNQNSYKAAIQDSCRRNSPIYIILLGNHQEPVRFIEAPLGSCGTCWSGSLLTCVAGLGLRPHSLAAAPLYLVTVWGCLFNPFSQKTYRFSAEIRFFKCLVQKKSKSNSATSAFSTGSLEMQFRFLGGGVVSDF